MTENLSVSEKKPHFTETMETTGGNGSDPHPRSGTEHAEPRATSEEDATMAVSIFLGASLAIITAYHLYPTVYKKARDVKRRLRYWVRVRALRRKFAANRHFTPLYRLPAEVLQLMVTFLPQHSATAFALTSTSISSTVGRQYLQIDDQKERLKFLRLLEPDLPGHQLCETCRIFHLRIPRGSMAVDRKEHRPRHHKLYACSTQEHVFSFNDASHIMRLFQDGGAETRKNFEKTSDVGSLFYGLRGTQVNSFRRVSDRLLLRVHIGFYADEEPGWQSRAISYPLFFCPHGTTSTVDLRHRCPGKGYKQFLKCMVCNTEIRFAWVDRKDGQEEYQVTRWFDLGRCYCPFDAQWAAVAGYLDPRELYPIKQEEADIKHTFEI